MNSEDVLIVGTGAMACLFAARLSAADVQVTMLGTWKDGLEALEQSGVRITEEDGKQSIYYVRTASDPSQCPGRRYAVVLVKSWQTERAAKRLSACLAPEGSALTLQNGIGNQEILAGELGEERVILGVTNSGAYLIKPGHVRSAGGGGGSASNEVPGFLRLLICYKLLVLSWNSQKILRRFCGGNWLLMPQSILFRQY